MNGQGTTLEFSILGPLRIDGDGREIELRAAKRRGLLALLLLQPQTLLSPERLVDDLWAGSPPTSAANTLQTYADQIRRAIGVDALVTRPGGYVLAVGPESIDA